MDSWATNVDPCLRCNLHNRMWLNFHNLSMYLIFFFTLSIPSKHPMGWKITCTYYPNYVKLQAILIVWKSPPPNCILTAPGISKLEERRLSVRDMWMIAHPLFAISEHWKYSCSGPRQNHWIASCMQQYWNHSWEQSQVGSTQGETRPCNYLWHEFLGCCHMWL